MFACIRDLVNWASVLPGDGFTMFDLAVVQQAWPFYRKCDGEHLIGFHLVYRFLSGRFSLDACRRLAHLVAKGTGDH